MDKAGKNFKCIGTRPSLLGDIISSLVYWEYLDRKYPDCYKTQSIAYKCKQIIPLLHGHHLIDKIHINRILEQPTREEWDFYNSHDLIIRPDLEHKMPNWQCYRNMPEEDLDMAGFTDWQSYISYEDTFPKLNKWFDLPPKENKTIALWGFAGYGKDTLRSPSLKYWTDLIPKLFHSGYKVIQFGATSEPKFNSLGDLDEYYIPSYNTEDLFSQVKRTLACDFMIGTDSGSSWLLSGYSFPMLTLITNWNKSHNMNYLALAPRNKNNISLFNPIDKEGCNRIDQNLVLEAIKIF